MDNSAIFSKLINLFNVSNMGLWEMNSNKHVFFYNASFFEQFNIPRSDSTIDDWIQLIHPDDRDNFAKNIQEHELSGREFYKSEYRVINKDGQYLWIESQSMATFDKTGRISWMFGTYTDITTIKNYEEKLFKVAYIDDLTQLPNAKKLILDIESDLSDEISGTLVFLDFSHLNHMLTIYGQDFIDHLITKANRVINDVFSETFDVYRFIPFVFSFKTNKPVDERLVRNLCDRLEQELTKVNYDFDLSSEVIYNAVMMSYPQEEYFPSCEDMFNRFFLTFEEKKGQIGTLTVYTSETKMRIRRKMFIETNLHKALDDHELFPVFQPIVSTKENKLFGFEALCRWTNPKWGAIYPDEFIDAAERNGAIIKIGAFMIDSACSFIHAYNTKHNTDLSVSINASVVELLNPKYFNYIRKALLKHKIKPSNLIIEITESLILDENANIIEQLAKLKAEGVGIAIDDFGTGYSSINTLFSTPTTEVKIDREVMLKLDSQPIIYDFIKSLVDLCHKYNIVVVAEGIEDSNMMEISNHLNMNYLQGYKFSKPLTFDSAIEYQFDS